MLLIVLGAVILVGPVSIARENRKQSPPSSGSKSSGSRQSSGTSSHRTAQPSRSGISYRQPSSPRSSTSRETIRDSRKTVSSRGTTLKTPQTGRINTPTNRQSDLGSSGRRDLSLNSRAPRKAESPLSDQTQTFGTDRTFRKQSDQLWQGDYDDHYRSRSLYHYNREYYPSRRIFYWISWPDCCRPICYSWGPRYTFGFFWPFYHRKFVFISLGGYWPCYTYRRYYWYGCHPYRWYGDCPPEYVIAGDTYNYYYYSDSAPRQDALGEAQKNLEEKAPAEPEQESQGDRYFEQATNAFEAGDYATSKGRFHDAMEFAPDDIVLPFAYVQALFASGEYSTATEALRKALIKTSPEKEGVFYPRGLYPDDEVLQHQVEQLERAIQLNPVNADLQLLLGYQLLGMGKHDEALGHLQSAQQDSNNTKSATLLIGLLEKLRGADDNDLSPNNQQAGKLDQSQSNNPKVKTIE